MKCTIIEIKKERRRKDVAQSRQEALQEYEHQQAEITKLLKQITAGLQVHDRNASRQGGHTWAHVGDLNRVAGELKDISDRLHGTGEYARVR